MNPSQDDPPMAREALLVFVGAICLILIQLMPLRSMSMLARPLWLDECITDLVVREASTSKAFVDLLAGGVDANPPAYYVLMRGLAFVGLHSPTAYRVTALICIAGALAGVYCILRRTFDPFAAAVGVAGLWSIGIAVEHTFEARFYSLLLLATVWSALFAARVEHGWTMRLGLALTAVVVCTTHWFGIVGLALVLVGECAVRRRDRRSIKPLWPAAAGIVALLACLPLLLAQKRAIGTETFVAGNPIRAAYAYYMLLLPGASAATVLAVALMERAVAGASLRKPPGSLKPQLPLLMLGLMPLALVIISYLMQPVMQLRYAIVAVAAMAVPVAFGASLIQRHFWRCLAAAGIGLAAFSALFRVWVEKKQFADELTTVTEHVRRAADGGAQVLFEMRHDQYPVIWSWPPAGEHSYFLADELEDESPLRRFERTMAFRTERLAGAPKIMSIDSAGARFIFIAESPDAARVMRYFPDAAVEPLGGRAFRVTR